MNLTMLLGMAADGMPERAAVGRRGRTTTYRELFDATCRFAGWAAKRSSTTIAFLGMSSDLNPVMLFGAARAGACFVPLNYRLADERLSALVETVAPVLVIADRSASKRIHGPGVEVVDREAVERELPRTMPLETERESHDDAAVLLFTSGTTGEPKAALLRHRHLVSYIISTIEFMSAQEDEAALVSVPPYHVAGTAAVLSSVYAGRRIVYLPTFDPNKWVETVRTEGVTHAMLIPTMLTRILEVLDGDSLPTLRHLAYGGGRMPLPVIERALELLPNVDFVNAYGLTETSSTVCLLGPDDHRVASDATDPSIHRRLVSVGRPLPGVELEIRDADGGRTQQGEIGEIWLRGEQVAGEYLGVPNSPDDWFRTKDLARVDTEGFVYLEGRSDDVIVRGGENLSPGEIEDALMTHPGVSEAAVVGHPDDEWGQVPVAFVVTSASESPSEEELRTWVRERLRSSRTPTRIMFLDELPYTETGKLLRRQLQGR